MQAKAFLFERARQAAEALGNVDVVAEEVALLVTDRTAEKAFSPAAVEGSDISLPLSESVALLARALHPLAALGVPGTGLVGAGPSMRFLHGVGLGAYRDLAASLAACGVSEEDAHQAAALVREGGALVLRPVEHSNGDIAGARAEWTLEVPDSARDAPVPVVPPAASTGEQHAEFRPAITPTDDVSRNREDR